jgi:hypothetical protein
MLKHVVYMMLYSHVKASKHEIFWRLAAQSVFNLCCVWMKRLLFVDTVTDGDATLNSTTETTSICLVYRCRD